MKLPKIIFKHSIFVRYSALEVMVLNSTVKTVLLIDDSEVDLFIQKRFIELSAFAENVITYSSPLKALDAFVKGTMELKPDFPGLIFLDLNMPILNGFEFLERLNNISEDFSSRYKVVILTSSNSESDKKRALEYPNVISFTSKPMNLHELERLTEKLQQHF